nr:integrase, catalytic region, zinc finger, CCHC-type, peptidase aspartic, catalytic [Tanacetum cinerariifolium]
IATTTIVPPRELIPIVNSTDKPVVTLVYSMKTKAANKKVTVSNSTITKSLIMGYGDYQIGNMTISRVYYMEGLGHNLFSVGQFCDSDLEVAFRQHTCFIHNLDGVDLLTGSRGNNLYTLSLQDMMASLPISCAMGKSTKKTYKPKSEDTNQEKLYLLHMDLCGPMRVESVNGKKYIISSLGPALNEMTPRIISAGLVQSSSPSTSYVPPSRNDWDLLFQPMFDELLNPPPCVLNHAPEVIAPIAKLIPPVQADSTDSPSLTMVDQDAPSLSKSHTTTEIQSSVIPQYVGDENLDIKVAHMRNDPLLGVSISAVISAPSSLTVSPHHIVQPDHPIPQHTSK